MGLGGWGNQSVLTLSLTHDMFGPAMVESVHEVVGARENQGYGGRGHCCKSGDVGSQREFADEFSGRDSER